ncbi:Short-chain dehydrogenase/reductase family 42E member 1 [Metarhizium brunneum]|uniref:Short-chain dehydrogenase/reductase family 42E member 1 n=1 Tax=Metarhizium brunneum TaxID=500148 RepID=A0A7D5Z5P4_9HYPO
MILLSLLVLLGVVVFIVRLNKIMTRTPELSSGISIYKAEALTREYVRRVDAKIKAEGIDFRKNHPPRLNRRYIVVGGSGWPPRLWDLWDLLDRLVGAQIILDLLDGGTPPSAIRLVDIRPPSRDEFSISGRASRVLFAQADITSDASTAAAFETPWPSSVARLPLTVFHTAAVIRPYERHPLFYTRCSRVNVVGTANSISAAQKAGADIFIFTSSSHVAARAVHWFSLPWRRHPRNLIQYLSDRDFFKPSKSPAEFPSNYARSKAEAERVVCAANTPGFRTGCIRPGNGVYGHRDDQIIGRMLRRGRVPTFSAPWVQSWVGARNVSLAHLLLQEALVGDAGAAVSGRPFTVTDEGPPMRFDDLYLLLDELSVTGLQVDYPPPAVLLLVAFAIEAYCVLLKKMPALGRLGLREPAEPMCLFQPGIVDSAVTQIADDGDARRPVGEGGLGYEGVCSTAEGLCVLVGEWNTWVEEQKKRD